MPRRLQVRSRLPAPGKRGRLPRPPGPEEQITVVLGASEGMAASFRSLLEPGDGVVVMQPYHELYPSQAAIFGLVPRFVTLREDRRAGT